MDASTYASILEAIRVPIGEIPGFEQIARCHDTSIDTIRSIFAQQWQTRVILRNQELQTHIPHFVASFLKGDDDFPSFSKRAELPPCHVLRRGLEGLPLGLDLSKAKITDVLKDPSVLLQVVRREVLGQALEEAGLPSGPDAVETVLMRLDRDVRWCVDHDAVYGPSCDVARREAGELYEAKLYESLKQADVAFSSESTLRRQGFIKTPDARLLVPITVKNHIVCWIDSKATFGDTRTHE